MSRARIRSRPISHNLDFGGIKPDFYTPVVLRGFRDNRYELLIGEDPNKEYSYTDHRAILRQYQLEDAVSITLMAFLFTSQSRRYLLVSELGAYINIHESEEASQGITDAMLRYGITQAFSVTSTFHCGYKLDQGFPTIDAKVVDKMLFDDWTLSIAKYHKWTVFEWLRFRLSMQAPEHRIGWDTGSVQFSRYGTVTAAVTDRYGD